MTMGRRESSKKYNSPPLRQIEIFERHNLTTMLLSEVQKQYHRAEAEAEVIKSQEQKIEALEERLSRLESVVETSLRTSENKTAYVPEGKLSQPLQAFRH